jgi:hypothetical protein
MTNSVIVPKYITELDSVHSKLESMKSLLVVFALILCMAKVSKFFASFFVMKKIKLVQDEPLRKRKNMCRLVTECDKPVSQRRATLVFFVDVPINKVLDVIHDTPTSRRTSTPVVKTTVDESAYSAFFQEKREYVKKWKEEHIKRQLFEMWYALGSNGQKEWLEKADALDKLFEMTNTSDVYKDTVTPKYPKTDMCKLISGYDSAAAFFSKEAERFKLFYQHHMDTDPYRTNDVPGQAPWQSKVQDNTEYGEKVLHAWKESEGGLRQRLLYDSLKGATKQNVHTFWPKVAKQWEAGFDAFEHAYDLFSQKVKNTDLQMKVTDEDVNEHISRMWEILNDDKVTNSTDYAYFCGCKRETLKKANPDMSKQDVTKELARMWRYLSKREKDELASELE